MTEEELDREIDKLRDLIREKGLLNAEEMEHFHKLNKECQKWAKQ